LYVPNLMMSLDLSYEILTKSSSRTDKANQNLKNYLKKIGKIADLDDFWEPHIYIFCGWCQHKSLYYWLETIEQPVPIMH
jgi:hypothetical protein